MQRDAEVFLEVLNEVAGHDRTFFARLFSEPEPEVAEAVRSILTNTFSLMAPDRALVMPGLGGVSFTVARLHRPRPLGPLPFAAAAPEAFRAVADEMGPVGASAVALAAVRCSEGVAAMPDVQVRCADEVARTGPYSLTVTGILTGVAARILPGSAFVAALGDGPGRPFRWCRVRTPMEPDGA